MPEEYDYILHCDASHFDGREYCGWAFALIVGDSPVAASAGRIPTTDVTEAEIFAIRKGLLSRPNLTKTLVLTDTGVAHAYRSIDTQHRQNAIIRSISAKGREQWHVWCHKEARKHAR